jgi:hypothetical protein
MAICPMLQKECIRERCAWWFESESEEYSQCAVTSVVDKLESAVDRLEDVKNDINVLDDHLERRQMY